MGGVEKADAERAISGWRIGSPSPMRSTTSPATILYACRLTTSPLHPTTNTTPFTLTLTSAMLPRQAYYGSNLPIASTTALPLAHHPLTMARKNPSLSSHYYPLANSQHASLSRLIIPNSNIESSPAIVQRSRRQHGVMGIHYTISALSWIRNPGSWTTGPTDAWRRACHVSSKRHDAQTIEDLYSHICENFSLSLSLCG